MGIEEIDSRQRRIAKAAQELVDLKDDPKALLEKAAELADAAKELEKAALGLAASVDSRAGGGKDVTVVLTPDQRERINENTGVAMETLVVRDPDGAFARAMPAAQKMIIERMANRQATVIALRKARREALEKLVKELGKLDAPGIDAIIKAIEEDPTLEALARQQQEAAEALKLQMGGQ
jgi:5'-deoxynucleotidase YfbR-like HD superfamily hydrolase